MMNIRRLEQGGDLPGSTYYHRVRTVRRDRLVPSRGCKPKRRIGRRRPRDNLLRCDDHGSMLRESGWRDA